MGKKIKRLGKIFITLLCIFVFLVIAWVVFSLIGRVKADSVIPESAVLRVSIANPVRLLDGILVHEPLREISAVPAIAPEFSIVKKLWESPLPKNRLLRFAAHGNLEAALLPSAAAASAGVQFILAWDMRILSPLARIIPFASRFVNVPNLYYVQAGKKSRFEYRTEGNVLFIGAYRNLLFVTDSSALYESLMDNKLANSGVKKFNNIKPSVYDAAFLLSPEFVAEILAGQDASIAAVLKNIDFGSAVEAGFSLSPKKLELCLAAQASSSQAALARLLEQRSSAPHLADRLPAAAQYATILSAGTLDELYHAALVFSSSALDEGLKTADKSSRALLGLTLNDLLFSWSGNEFAVFGMEGRPHPVYAIQIADERKRQEVFNKAFKSIALGENVSLTLDGNRIPRIEVPYFLQSLLEHWNIYIPSPYYTVYKGHLLASESAEALLAALRAMQKNDVLPGTAAWRNIAGGKAASSAFSLYYSLDLSMPFFLRKNTGISSFLGVYRQGLLRMSFNKGIIEINLSLIPGSGSGVTLAGGYPLDVGRNPSNQIYGYSKENESRIFLTRGNTAGSASGSATGSAISVNTADNSIYELAGQSPLWVVPAEGMANNNAAAWVVTGQGRVTLVNENMEPAQGFPVLTGIRLSSPPAANNGKLYLCGDNGKIYTVDANGEQAVWDTSFPAAVRSAPSFISIPVKQGIRRYAAVYPKSFFGEIWLLDSEGRVLPNWPVPVSGGKDQQEEKNDSEDFTGFGQQKYSVSSGIAFGSPLLFAHNSRVHVAFVTQDGELSVFDESAAYVPPFPMLLDGVFYQQPVFDGDYFWLVSSNGTLIQVSFTGEILRQNIPGFSVKEEGFITVFDCDSDKVPEIFISGEGNALYGFNRHFRSLEGFPLPVWGKPLFIEPRGNEKAEIIGVGMDHKLYRWQFR